MNTAEEKLLSKPEIDELASLMNKKYASFIDDRKFEIAVSEEGPGVKAKVVLKNEDNSFYYPIEARILHKEEELSASEALLFLIDYIDLYFEEYLTEDEDLFIPIDWAKYQYEAVDFELKGQLLNLKLESMGDELLQNSGTDGHKK